jgi:hypothetical protein
MTETGSPPPSPGTGAPPVAVAPQPQAGGRTPTSLLATGKDIVGLAAAVGAVLFLILSVLYDQFYGPLGLEPEDVGLTQAAIVARSAAGIIAIMALTASVTGIMTVISFALRLLQWTLFQLATRSMTPEQQETYEATLNSRLIRLTRSLARVLPGTQLMVFPGDERPANPLTANRRGLISIVSLCVGLALIGTLTLGWQRVTDASDDARAGRDVSPPTFLGLRLLDISSAPCRAIWLSAQPAPKELSDPDLHCLGEGGGSTLFRTPTTTIRVPSAAVSTAFN